MGWYEIRVPVSWEIVSCAATSNFVMPDQKGLIKKGERERQRHSDSSSTRLFEGQGAWPLPDLPPPFSGC